MEAGKIICGIYKITSPSERVYIGQGVNIYNRYKKYKINSCKGQTRLYNSILKYGWENHLFEIIEECEVEDLNSRERFWQDKYDVLSEKGLNCKLTKTDTQRIIYSEESRKKMSESQKGKKASEETKQKMRDSARRGVENQNYGRVMSEEQKNKIREANKGSKHLVGIVRSEETKQKIREAFSKLVICLETGIFYSSAKEASEVYNIKYDTLLGYLSNRRKNKTNLVYT